jgi:hypothetical protein
MKYLLLFVPLFLISCTDHDVSPEGASSSLALSGTWVEATNRKDTIVFITSEPSDPQMFSFKCEKGISGYNNLFSSLYQFKVEGNEISLLNTISSCYCFTDYSFSRTDTKIHIENFYESGSEGEIETFVPLD